MNRIMIVPAVLSLWAQPAFAGGWGDYDTYEAYRYEERIGGDVAYEVVPAYRAPYDSYDDVVIEDGPPSFDANCEMEQEWSPGHYRETIECDAD